MGGSTGVVLVVATSSWAALVTMLRSVLSLAVAVVSAVMLAPPVAHSTLAGTHVVVMFRVLAGWPHRSRPSNPGKALCRDLGTADPHHRGDSRKMPVPYRRRQH